MKRCKRCGVPVANPRAGVVRTLEVLCAAKVGDDRPQDSDPYRVGFSISSLTDVLARIDGYCRVECRPIETNNRQETA